MMVMTVMERAACLSMRDAAVLPTFALRVRRQQQRTSLPKVIWEEGRVAAKLSPHWLQCCAPNSPPRVPLPVDRSPNRTTCLIPGPVRSMMPTASGSDAPFFHNALDRPTDARPTDRPREQFDRHRPLRFESDAAYNNNNNTEIT